MDYLFEYAMAYVFASLGLLANAVTVGVALELIKKFG